MPGVITNVKAQPQPRQNYGTRGALESYTLRLAPRASAGGPGGGGHLRSRRHRLADFAIGTCQAPRGVPQARLWNRNLRTGGLRHRLAAGLRGAVQHRPGSDLPAVAFRLYYGGHQHHTPRSRSSSLLESLGMAQGLKLGLHIPANGRRLRVLDLIIARWWSTG